MKRAAKAILLSAVAMIQATASIAQAQWQSVPIENASTNSNNWFFFPDEASDPRIVVKGNQNNQVVPIKVLEGGPPTWTASVSDNVSASGLSTFVQTGSGSGKLIAAHLDGTRSIRVVDFVNGEPVGIETAVSNISSSLVFGTLSAAVDSAGFVHIVYTLSAGTSATNSTLVYLRRNVSTGDWAKHEVNITSRVMGTSVVAPTTSTAVLYFTTQALHRCTLDSFANGNPLMTNFSVLHVAAQGIVSGALKATRVSGVDRILYFYSTGQTTWQFARMDYTSSVNFAPKDIQDVGAVSGSVALPLSIHVAAGSNGKEHIAWYDLRSRRIHYLVPGSGSDGIPYNATQPVTLPNQPSGVPDSDLHGLHIRTTDDVPFLLYRRTLNTGFVAFPGDAIPSPEIAVLGPTNANLNDNAAVSFGNVVTGEEKFLSFTIKNTGDVTMTGIVPTIVAGPSSGDYTITTPPATSLAPNESTVFTVRFVPAANGKRPAKLQIANNDFDENPFDINLGGTGTPPQIPEISLAQGKVIFTDGASESSWGSVTLGAKPKTLVFTVSNVGLASLTGVAATIDGANASDFTITKAPLATIAGRKKTTVSIAFNPSALGDRTAVLHIASNDADENPFDLVLKGTGIGAEIAVEQPVGSDLTDGVSSRDFGSADIGGTVPLTFTVRNDGNIDMKGIGVKFIGGTPKDFILTTKPLKTVVPAASTTFTVTFKPKAAGLRTTTLRVTSNDADEKFFEVTLNGTGTAPLAALSRSVSAGSGHPIFAAMNEAGLEGIAAEPGAVPHADGVENLLKYAFNLNLGAADCRTLVPGTGTAGLPVVAASTQDGTTVLRFEYIRRKDAGLVYQPKFSADLNTWSAPDREPVVTAIDEVWERVVYELPAPGSGPRFAVVEVGFAAE